MGQSCEYNFKENYSVISRCISFALVYYILIAAGGSIISGVDGHIAAFVSTDGKPNVATRALKGPTVPPVPESIDSYNPPRTFGFIRNFARLPGSLGHENDKHHHSSNPGNPYANVNKEDWSSEINEATGSDDYFLGKNGQQIDKATFTPYISARALSNIPEFFQHLRDNLEALHEEEMNDSDYENSEGGDGLEMQQQRDILKHHSRREEPMHGLTIRESPDEARILYPDRSLGGNHLRWRPIASGRMNMEGQNPHNTQSFVEMPTFQESLMRRATNNYNPSWSYTKLGLGKRGR